MPVPFGVSVGDFIALGILFKDVGVALKDKNGAASDFQETQRNLETTIAILQELETFESSSGNSTQINAIRAQAHLVQQDIDDCLEKIKKYEKALGVRATKGILHGTAAKIKWSQYVAGQVQKLARKVDVQVTNIQLLLQLDLGGAVSQLAARLKRQEKASVRHFDHHTALIADHATVTKSLQHSVQTLGHNTLARVTDSHLDLSLRLERFERETASASEEIQSRMATALDVQELKDLVTSRFPRQCDETCVPSQRHLTAERLRLTLTIPQLHISIRDAHILLQHLVVEVEAILGFCLSIVGWMLRDLLLVLPQLVIVVKVLQRLPQAVSLVLRDNMSFEDALGRFHSLQFQQFRHWAVFEASLLCTFQNQPGLEKVQKGHFILTCSDVFGHTLTEKNWHSHLRPGFSIKMSIMIKRPTHDMGRCLRCCESMKLVPSASEYHCLRCHVVYAVGTLDRRDAGAFSGVELCQQNLQQFDGHHISESRSIAHPDSTPLQRINVRSTPADLGLQRLMSLENLREQHEETAGERVGVSLDYVKPFHYDTWLREMALEAIELRLLKRVYLDGRNAMQEYLAQVMLRVEQYKAELILARGGT